MPGAARLMPIGRYRPPLTSDGTGAACRAATASGDGDDLGLTACARAHGAKMSCETVLAITALPPAQASPAFLLARNRHHCAIATARHHDATAASSAPPTARPRCEP